MLEFNRINHFGLEIEAITKVVVLNTWVKNWIEPQWASVLASRVAAPRLSAAQIASTVRRAYSRAVFANWLLNPNPVKLRPVRDRARVVIMERTRINRVRQN